MGLPVETRHHILGHALYLDQSLDFDLEEHATTKSTFMLLQVCRKLRAEALDVIKMQNALICLVPDKTSYPPTVDLEKRLRDMIQSRRVGLPLASLIDTPLLTVGYGEDSESQVTATSSQAMRNKLYFLYTPHTFGMICILLFSNSSWCKELTLHFKSHLAPAHQQLRDKMLEYLCMICGMWKVNTRGLDLAESIRVAECTKRKLQTVDDTLAFLKTFKAKGDEAMTKGNFAEAILIYELGGWATDYAVPTANSSDTNPHNLKKNTVTSLVRDISRCQCKARNKLVEARRDRGTGMIKDITKKQLELAVTDGRDALAWPGITDEQMANAHYFRGIAWENRADYEVTHGQVRNAREMYEDAAKDLFLARNLKPEHLTMKQALSRVDKKLGRATTKEHVPIHTYSFLQPPWKVVLDARLPEEWLPGRGAEAVSAIPIYRLRG
jgi:hypothetical protein